MDCEKFDRIVLDLLYEELDELTTAAAKRHMEHCSRCRSIGQGLRATRQIGVLPLVEAPAGLEERILSAERKARERLPVRERVGRTISVLAGYAMRPQLAMAALLLLMIGSSLLFLRARPGARESVQVTERGVPESENDNVTVVPAPERARAEGAKTEAHGAPAAAAEREAKSKAALEPSPFASPAPGSGADKPMDGIAQGGALGGDGGTGDDTFDKAMADYRAGRYADAQKNFDVVAAQGGGNAASAALFAAQAVRNDVGCSAAAPRFETINARNRGSGIGNEAAWQAADCYRALGQLEDARRNYKQLIGVAGYDERAQRALATLDQEHVASRAKAGKAPAAKPPAAAPPAKAGASQPAETKKAAPAPAPKSDTSF